MLNPGMTVELKRGPFKGSTAEVTEVHGSLVKANLEVFGTTQSQEFSYADFGLEYVATSRPFKTLLEEFDGLYSDSAPRRFQLLQEGLGSNATDRCNEIPGVQNVPEELIQLYQWKNGMQHLEDGWINEFEDDLWFETTVLDNSTHFNSLESVVATIEMWEKIAEERHVAKTPCHWRTGFLPILEAPFWQLSVVDTIGLFGGKPNQIIKFDYKSESGFVMAHENLNKWLETQIERLKAGVMFAEWSLKMEKVERGINEYYTRQFPDEIPIDRE